MSSFQFRNITLQALNHITAAFADYLAGQGGLVCLYGDIGVGKTAFIKSLCKYLQVQEEITSPSFVILNEYTTGRLPIYHFDLYRLEVTGVESILGELDEYMHLKNAVIFVEWANFSNVTLPDNRLDVFIEYTDKNQERTMTFCPYGLFFEGIVQKLHDTFQHHCL